MANWDSYSQSGVLVCNKASPVGEFKADLGSHDQSGVPPLPSAFPPLAGAPPACLLRFHASPSLREWDDPPPVTTPLGSRLRGNDDGRANGGRSLKL